MNTVYKVIWNSSLGAWIAVSELAKGNKKSSKSMGFIGGVASTLLAVTFSAQAQAAVQLGTEATASAVFSTAIGDRATATARESTTVGNESSVSGAQGSAFGAGAVVTGTQSTAIGYQASVSANSALALGYRASATVANSIALGANATTTTAANPSFLTNKALSTVAGVVSVGSDTEKRRIQNLADGADSQDAVTVAQLRVVNNKTIATGNRLATVLGGGAVYDPANGGLTAPSYNVTNPTTGTTTAVNNVGAAINGLNTSVNSPITFKDKGTGTSVNKLGSEFAIVGDDNITTTVTDGQAAIALNKGLKGLTSVETTDGTNTTTIRAGGTTSTDGKNRTVYGPNGLNINNGAIIIDSAGLNAGGVIVSKDGINANDKVISNVGNGSLAAGSKDAINGGQVNTVKNDLETLIGKAGKDGKDGLDTLAGNISDALGGGAGYDKGTSTWTPPSYNVTDPITGITTPVNNVGAAIDGLNTAVNSPITFKDAGTGTSVNKLGSEFAIVGDDNITTTVTDGQAAIALNKDLKGLTSVETTDGTNTTTIRAGGTTSTDGTNTTVYGANGLNINNGAVIIDSAGLNAGGVIVSKDGINANDKVISNVGDAQNVKDATNLGQVENLIADATSSITTKGFSLTAQDGNTVNRKLGEAIEIEGDDNISTSVKDDKLAINLAKDLKVDSISAGGSILNSSGLIVGNTTVTSNGVFIQNGPSISSNGIDAGNKTISNIAAGVNAGDAVNKGQFDETLNDVKNNIEGLTDSAVQYDKNADGSVNKDSITLGGSNGTAIGNVADGKVEIGSKDAINGGQLANVRDDLQGQINENTSNISSIKNEISNGSLGLVKQDKDTANITVAKDTGGKKFDVSGTDGNRVITGIGDGNIVKGSSDAVTAGQLNTTYENLASSLGGSSKFENGTWTGPNYTVGHGNSAKNVDNVGDVVTALNNADQVLDTKINTLGNRLDDAFRSTNDRVDRLEKDTKAAVAASIAIASLPQPFEKGTAMLSAGTGVWEGQVGVSIGASGITEDKKIFETPVNYVWKLASTTDSQGKWGGGASVGVQWK